MVNHMANGDRVNHRVNRDRVNQRVNKERVNLRVSRDITMRDSTYHILTNVIGVHFWVYDAR